AGYREKRRRDAVESALIAAERRKKRLPEVRHIADDRLEPRIDQHLLRRHADGDRQLGSGHQQQRLATLAAAESADAVDVQMIAILRMREDVIERARQRQR